MGAEGAAEIVFRREIDAAEDKAGRRQELVNEYRETFSNPFVAAGRRLVDDIIDPAETRKYLADALESLHTKRELRPAKKHKFRFSYIPISYSAEGVLSRTIVFNGQAFAVSLPVNSSLEWKAWTFGYEYDFIYRDAGFLGVIVEAKYTDATVNIANPLTTEYAHVKAPIPTIGAVGRVYLAANLSITGEFTAFKLPATSGALQGYDGHYYDFNLYGTLNFTDHYAVQAGYRSLAVAYRKDLDSGDLVLKGPYTMVVIRF